MKLYQKNIQLKARSRGFHLVTDEILNAIPEIRNVRSGMCQVFLQHTSAGLTINENADRTVRMDFETYFNKAVPENDADYRHNDEGPDDMPAHVKSSLTGQSVLIPVQDGQLALGTWQGIYLCEFRNNGGSRRVIISLWGVSFD